MTFSELKNIVGISGIRIKSSSLRYSELYALAERVGIFQSAVLTIVVEDGTLTPSEIKTLAQKGGPNISFDFAED